MKTYFYLICLLVLSISVSWANEPVRPIVPSDLLNPEEFEMVKVKGARVAWADFAALRRDFPQLRSKSDQEINRWIIDNFAYMNKVQLKLNGIRQSDIPIESNNIKIGYRPPSYNRAAVLEAKQEKGFSGGLIDIKGNGNARGVSDQLQAYEKVKGQKEALDALKTKGHSDGLMSLGEAVAEVIRQQAIQKSFDVYNAKNNTNFQSVESYFVIALPTRILKSNGVEIPAALYARQTHIDRLNFQKAPDSIYVDRSGSKQRTISGAAVDMGGVIITDPQLTSTFGTYDIKTDPQSTNAWRYSHSTADGYIAGAESSIYDHVRNMLGPIEEEWKKTPAAKKREFYSDPTQAVTDKNVHTKDLLSLVKDADVLADKDLKTQLIADIAKIKPAGDVAAISAVKGFLGDAEADLYAQAALGKLTGEKKYQETFENLMKDTASAQRLKAAIVLGDVEWNNLDLSRKIAKLVADSDRYVQSAAVKALGKIKPNDPICERALIPLITSNVKYVRDEAAESLFQINPINPELAKYEQIAQKKLDLSTEKILNPADTVSVDEAKNKIEDIIGKKGTVLDKITVLAIEDKVADQLIGGAEGSTFLSQKNGKNIVTVVLRNRNGYVSREAFLEELSHVKQVRKHPEKVARIDSEILESYASRSRSEYAIGDKASTIIKSSLPVSFAKFVAAQAVKDGFFIVSDQLKGQDSGEDFSKKLTELVSDESVLAYGSFSAVSAASEKAGTKLRPGFKAPMAGLGFVAAQQADQLSRYLIKRKSRGESFDNALSGALQDWKEGFDPESVGVSALSFIASQKAVRMSSETAQTVHKIWQAKKKVQAGVGVAASAQASTGVGFVTAVMEEAAIFILTDVIVDQYQKESMKFKVRDKLKTIDKLLDKTKDLNPEEMFSEISKHFSDLRDMRRAWEHMYDKEVETTYKVFQDALNDLYRAQNYFREFGPGQLLKKMKDGSYATFNLKKGIFEKDPEFNSCLKKAKTRSINETACMNDFTVCRHLSMLKSVAVKLKQLEEKKIIYNKSLQRASMKTASKIDPLSHRFGDYIKNDGSMAPGDENSPPGEIYEGEISKFSITDLYKLERIAYYTALNKAGILSKNNEFEKPKDGKQEKLLEVASEANLQSLAGQALVTGVKPQSIFSRGMQVDLNCEEPNEKHQNLAQQVGEIVNGSQEPIALIVSDQNLWNDADKHYSRGRKIEGINAEQCTSRLINCKLSEHYGVTEFGSCKKIPDAERTYKEQADKYQDLIKDYLQ